MSSTSSVVELRASQTTFTNAGSIAGGGVIPFSFQATVGIYGSVQFVNTGTITGPVVPTSGPRAPLTYVGAIAAYSPDAILNLSNSGSILGGINLSASTQNNRIINSGRGFGVEFGSGNDYFDGSAGDDVTVIAGLGSDAIIGSRYADYIYGGTRRDGPAGDAGDVSDTIYGGAGADLITGGYGDDLLYGNQDNDVLYGNQGSDILYGGQHSDVPYGGQSDDQLNGDRGNDLLYGGQGADTFVFKSFFGNDTVADFGYGGLDRIRFVGETFTDYQAVVAHMTQVGADVLITNGAGESVRIVGTTLASMTSDKFMFG